MASYSFEQDIEDSMKTKKRDWTRLYKLLKRAHDDGSMWDRYGAQSFSGFVKALAKANHMYVSAIWRTYKAGSILDDYNDRHPDKKINVSMKGVTIENLTTVDKLIRYVGEADRDELEQSLMKKLIDGKLNRKLLGQLYKMVREEKDESVQQVKVMDAADIPVDADIRKKAMESTRAYPVSSSGDNEDIITITEAADTLSDGGWIFCIDPDEEEEEQFWRNEEAGMNNPPPEAIEDFERRMFHPFGEIDQQPHYNMIARFPLDVKNTKKNVLDALILENMDIYPRDGHLNIHGFHIALGMDNFMKWLREYGENKEFECLCREYLDDYYVAVSERWPELFKITGMVPDWIGICRYDGEKGNFELIRNKKPQLLHPTKREHTLERALMRFTSAVHSSD